MRIHTAEKETYGTGHANATCNIILIISNCLLIDLHLLRERQTPTDATRREEEPIHKNALAVVIGIVGKKTVPFVFLFTTAVTRAATRSRFPISNVIEIIKSINTLKSGI